MKTITTYMLLPISILAIGVLLLLIRILPRSWCTLPLGLLAMLITTMPAQGVDRMVTCYEPMSIDQTMPDTNTATQALMNTPEWASYRSAYIYLLDYMAAAKFSDESFSKLLTSFNQIEANLNKIVATKGVSQKTMSVIFDGMDNSTTGYEKIMSGTTCYKMMTTPEVMRKFALGEAVSRQIQLRKLILQNTIVAQETIRMTKESIFVDIDKYLSGTDLESYKMLMIDLVQISD